MKFDIQDADPIRTGCCFGCNREGVELFWSPDGLRCANCFNRFEDTRGDTYVPSLRHSIEDETDERLEQAAENIDNFTESIPDIGLSVEFSDGSEVELDKIETYAVFIKYGEQWDVFVEGLRSKVNTHYRNKRKPTRHGTTRWREEDEFETKAELATEIVSSDLRGAKMQTAFKAMAGDDEDGVNVVGLGDSSVTYYSDDGSVVVPYNGGDDV